MIIHQQRVTKSSPKKHNWQQNTQTPIQTCAYDLAASCHLTKLNSTMKAWDNHNCPELTYNDFHRITQLVITHYQFPVRTEKNLEIVAQHAQL